jgi:hypothetical protein
LPHENKGMHVKEGIKMNLLMVLDLWWQSTVEVMDNGIWIFFCLIQLQFLRWIQHRLYVYRFTVTCPKLLRAADQRDN